MYFYGCFPTFLSIFRRLREVWKNWRNHNKSLQSNQLSGWNMNRNIFAMLVLYHACSFKGHYNKLSSLYWQVLAPPSKEQKSDGQRNKYSQYLLLEKLKKKNAYFIQLKKNSYCVCVNKIYRILCNPCQQSPPLSCD